MQRHILVSWSHINKAITQLVNENLGKVHILKPRPLCPLPLFCVYINSRGHGSQMDPNYMCQVLEVLFFTSGLEKGGGWMVFIFWLLVEDDFRSTQR